MLITSFKAYTPTSLLKVPLWGLFLWFFSVLYRNWPDNHLLNQGMPLFTHFNQALSGLFFLKVFIAFLLTLSSAFLLNYIVNEHNLLSKKTYLPALLYLIYNSCCGDFLRLNPSSFSNLLIIAACHQLFNTYRQDSARPEVFNAGVLLGLASTIYLPSLVLFLFIWVALIIYRPFIWQEYMLSLLGFLLPWVYFVVYYFWNDQLKTMWVGMVYKHTAGKYFQFSTQPSYIWLYLVFGTVILLSFLGYTTSQLVMPLKSKKTFSLLLWCFLIGVLSVYLAPVISIASLSVITIPLAVISANLFLQIKKTWLAEVLFSFLLLAVLIVHLGVFLQK